MGGDFDLSTPTGRANARMRGTFARQEMELKAQRQARAGLQRAQNGETWWPTRPFGFTTHKPPRLNRSEGKLIRDAYQEILAGGSLRGVAAQWNRCGVKTPKGNSWRGSTVRQLLTNPRNAGLRGYQRGGEVLGPGKWPAIVDENTWRAVQAVLADPARLRGPASRGRKHLMSGMAVCGRCQHPMTSGTLASGVLQYVCKQCGRVSRNMARVDDYIIRIVCERLSRPDAKDLLLTSRTPDTARLRNEITTLRARQDELAASFANGQINGNQMRVGTATLDAKIAELEARIVDANRVRVFEGAIASDPVQVRKRFEAFNLDRRRAIVDALLTVTIYPGQPSHGKLRVDLLPVEWKD